MQQFVTEAAEVHSVITYRISHNEFMGEVVFRKDLNPKKGVKVIITFDPYTDRTTIYHRPTEII